MKNNTMPDSDFENFMRKHLQEKQDAPDAGLWDRISGKQQLVNRRIKIRRYGWYAVVATGALLLFSLVWQSRRQSHRLPAGIEKTQQPTSPPENGIIANALPVQAPHTEAANARKLATAAMSVPNFGPRENTVPANTVHFNASRGIRYQHPITQTVVEIPANSLVDARGIPVSGDAELYFREYRSIADFLASGLPMHYSDSRGEFFFNSGGMFEVRVSQHGKPLQIAAGQAYGVSFVPTNSLDKASLYYLDDRSGAWSFVPDAGMGQDGGLKQPPVASELEAIRGNTQSRSGNCLPDPYDIAGFTDPADMLKTGIETGMALASGKLQMPRWFLKNPYLTDDELLFRMEKGLVEVKKHRDNAQLFFPEDLNHYFTELAAFKDCYFTYNTGELNGIRESGKLTRRDYWQRVIVEQVKNNMCIVTLYDGKEGQLQFHATLCGSTDNKNFDPDSVMQKYSRLRLERQQAFAAKNQALRYFLQASPLFKTKEEYCMPVLVWLDYFEKNHALMAKRYQALIDKGYTTDRELATAAWNEWRQKLRNWKFQKQQADDPSGIASNVNALMYSLKLFRFGVYNCDQIFRLGEQTMKYVLARYKTDKGEVVVPAKVNVLEKRTRLCFTQQITSHILYLPGRWLDFIITDRSGRQFLLPARGYAKQYFNKTGVTVLTLNEVTDKTDSPQAWADLLNI